MQKSGSEDSGAARRLRGPSLAFLAGVVCAVLTVAIIKTSNLPPGAPAATFLIGAIHPFLRLPVQGNTPLVVASVLFNGIYYALAVMLIMRLRRPRSRLLIAVIAIVVLRVVLVLAFETSSWLTRGRWTLS